MDYIEGTFKGVRDLKIYHQAWLPRGDVDAVLLIVHGLGEHSGRYVNVVNHFVPRGYAVCGFDLPGHGKSGGQREFVRRFTDYTDTLRVFHQTIKRRHADDPIFLFGHSMGGLIALHYLLDNQAGFRGAVLSSPLLKTSEAISPATIIIGKILSALVPRIGLLPLDAEGICRDPDVVEAYVNDPLVHQGRTPARLAAELLQAMRHVTAELDQLTLPFIVVQAGDDKLVDPAGAEILYHGASSEDKTLKIYDRLYHEVCNEPEREQVLQDLETWLAARL